MKVRDIMTPRPLSARDDERPDALRRLARAGQVHHLPVVHAGQLVGLWLVADDGPMVLLGPERIAETTADADAADAMAKLVGDCEAVVVWDAGDEPVGVITRSDALALIRAGLGAGLGRRRRKPVVLRLIGPAGAGKSTLLARTLERVRHCRAAVVQVNADHVEHAPGATLGGAPVLAAPDAHYPKGLARAVEAVGDAQLVIVEDRDARPDGNRGIGEDAQALVVPAEAVDLLKPEQLREAQALLVTKLDEAPKGFDLPALRSRLARTAPHLAVFGLAALHDDRGLEEWVEWLEARVLRART